jgi:hypothetical protein
MLAAAAAVVAAFATAPAAADAGILVASASNCEEQALERPFARWLDPLSYHLVPDGGFEQGAAGWTLSKAKVVNGNEPFYVHGAGETKSLSLPPGSVATSPVMCAGIHKPFMRFFAKSSGGLLSLSTLSVEVLFETSRGQVLSLPVGVVLPNTKWQPSLPLPVLASLLPLLPGEQTPIAFRFRPLGGATWTIDDVYLDPAHR